MGLRSERLQLEHAGLYPGGCGFDRREHRIDRDLCQIGELALPEGIEVGRSRRRQTDLRWRDGGADGVKPGVASGIAARETWSLAGWHGSGGHWIIVGLNRHVNHPWL